jgi:hypothetical protein
MLRVGQPYQRLGARFTYCAHTKADRKVVLVLSLTEQGRVSGVRRR